MLKKINNPFTNSKEYNCFGCSPNNPIGIKLDFFIDDIGKVVTAEWEPSANYVGYNNILHGGIQATLLDEIASWVVYAILGTGGVTSQMHIRYRKPVNINDGKIQLKACLNKQEKCLADIRVELRNGKGELSAEGTIQYFIYPESTAKEKMGYPGIDSFV
ncbi:MAG TPA: PaaI family thioesterase [Tenuifilaceae bacterium]|nr:PaaI family thioesterase [Tenuifilaceae bacterium]HPW26895.1 PaaI family thioesterase [Tenuifilaceae bacterium]